MNKRFKRQKVKQMSETIRSASATYESKETKNIAELEVFDIDTPMKEVEYTKEDGSSFSVNEVEIEGEKYRVPTSVLKQIKTLINDNPSLSKVKVVKSGSGLNTQYQVIPQ